MSENNVYAVADVVLMIANIPIDSGLPEGDDWISVEYRKPVAEVVDGIDGSTTINRMPGKSAIVKVKLAGSSSGNDRLSVLFRLFQAGKGATGIGPFLLQDLSGRAIYQGAKCVPTDRAKPVFGSKRGEMEWTFVVTQLDGFDGGNTPA